MTAKQKKFLMYYLLAGLAYYLFGVVRGRGFKDVTTLSLLEHSVLWPIGLATELNLTAKNIAGVTSWTDLGKKKAGTPSPTQSTGTLGA